MQYEVGNHKWAFITMYLYIKVYNTLSIFASLCHILPPSCSNGFFRRCCGRFTWLTRELGQEPRLRRCQRNELTFGISDHHSARTIPYCLTKISKTSGTICLFSSQSSSLSVKTTVSNLKQQKNKKFRFHPNTLSKPGLQLTAHSPPWRHMYVYIYGRVKRQKVKPGIFWVHCRCYHHPKGCFLAGHLILQKFPSS